MGRFWDAATEQAGREFGARHYGWFAGARIVRRLAPAIIGVGIVVAAVAGYRWWSPDWPAAGNRISSWASAAWSWAATAGPIAAGVLVGAIVVAAAVVIGRWVHGNWWRWSLSRPMWMRRY